MKPQILTIENFGPFVSETVDFNKVGDEVYMIVGNTGAGKTMIFDAISFALFGRASGDWRKTVSPEELYCRYGSMTENGGKKPMKVGLSFSEKGKDYYVERILKWGDKGKSKNANYESCLEHRSTGEESIKVTNAPDSTRNDVTNRVIELIGLRAQDFKKIVMLAQGEFQQFLKASGAERNEILGRLYDNRRHIDLQTRLYGVWERLNSRIRGAEIKIGEGLSECTVPEDMPEDTKIILSNPKADRDEIEKVLADLTEKLEEICEKTTGEKKETDKKRSELSLKLSECERNNKELKDLGDLIEQKKRLDEKAAEYDGLKKKIELVKAALLVMPAAKNYEDRAKKLDETEKDVAGLKEEIDKMAAEEEGLKEKRNSAGREFEEGSKRIGKRLNLLEKVMPEYEALEKAKTEAAKALTEKTKADERYKNAVNQFEKVSKDEEDNELLLSELEEAGETAVRIAKTEEGYLETRVKDLCGLVTDIEGCEKRREEEAAALTEYDKAAEERADIQAELDLMNKKMRLGRAALLAADLVKTLEENGEAKCPVCGTLHTKADIGNFAKSGEDMPKEGDLDKTVAVLKTAQDKESELALKHEKCKNAYDNVVKNVRNSAERLLGKDFGEGLPTVPEVRDEIQKAEDDLTKARRKLDDAVIAKKRKEEALEKRRKLADLKKTAEKNRDDAREELGNIESTLVECNAALKAAAKALEGYPEDKGSALSEAERLKEEAEKLRSAAKAAEDAYNDLKKKKDINEGRLKEGEKLLKSLEKEKEATLKKYENGLKEAGFESEEAYHDAMSPEGRPLESEKDLRIWQEEKSKEVKTYKESVNDLKSRIDEHEEKCRDLVMTDLKPLEEEQRDLNREYAGLDKLEKEEYLKLGTTKKACDKVRRSFKEKEKLVKACDVIKPMYENTGKKYKFQDYVLEGFFEEIVNHASGYFSELMDGKLSLSTVRHKNKTDQDNENDTLKGFEIAVNDESNMNSNVALLSGGQSFEASLALALGLSEVVQMQRAGKVHIDSMFIDEGFGTLDGTRLERSMEVLAGLAGKKRQIGIITHVDKLVNAEQYKKLEVKETENGSRISFSDNR